MHRRRYFFSQRWLNPLFLLGSLQNTRLWQFCPLLFWGVYLALLIHLLVEPTFVIAVCFLLLTFSKKYTKNDLILGLIFSSIFCYSLYTHHKDQLDLHKITELEIVGEGLFKPAHYIKRKTLVREQILVKGTLERFGPYKNIPASIDIKAGTSLELGHVWQIAGTLKVRDGRGKIKASSLRPLEGTFALAGFRDAIKSTFQSYLQHVFSLETSQLFYTIFTGEITHASLNAIFSKTGQKQLLVVSGLHFALIGTALQILFAFFLPWRFNLISTLLLLSLYFLWIGYSPAICRAYIGFAFYSLTTLASRYIHPLQSLGTSMTLQCLLDPLSPLDLGFQLSYLATASIILFATTPQRNRLKKALYLQGSVQLATAYPLLQQIGYIPTISLLISLYFPAMLSLLLFLFILLLPISIFSLSIAKIIYLPIDLLCQGNLELLRITATRFPGLITCENVFVYILLAVLLFCFGYATRKNFFIEKSTQY